jgi:hypothetical protein
MKGEHKTADPESMSVADLEKELDRRDALRVKGEAYDREGTRALMEARNRKILEDQADTWGLSVEEYQTAKEEASEHLRLEAELHAAQTRRAKLVNRAQVVRVEGEEKKDQSEDLAEMKKLSAEIPKLEAALEQAKKNARPLHVHLNKARVKALKEMRLAQTASAKPVNAKASAKPSS